MKTKIVLAEDQEAEYEIIKLLIDEKYHYEIDLVHFENGNNVIDYINNNDVDILLLDINIPGKNGKEIAKYVRNDLKKYFPIIILSTSDNEKDIKECYEYCINSYLVKPIDFNIFEEMLDRVIEYWISFNKNYKDDYYG